MNVRKFTLGFFFASMFAVTAASASEIEVSGGADLVSQYVIHGMDQGQGAAFQPTVTASMGGLSLTAWGSTPLDSGTGAKELDLILAYSVGNFSFGVTDYWWTGLGAKSTYLRSSEHMWEVNLAYTISEDFPLSLSWNTMFAGDADKKDALGIDDSDDQAFSTWVKVAYPFTVGSVDCTASVEVTPWEGCYASEFNVTSVSLRFSKDISGSDKFSLPIFVEAIAAPAQEDAYLVAGISFSL
ncbi:MAG: TorF family putative porin [Rikenellaceae bacterium]